MYLFWRKETMPEDKTFFLSFYGHLINLLKHSPYKSGSRAVPRDVADPVTIATSS